MTDPVADRQLTTLGYTVYSSGVNCVACKRRADLVFDSGEDIPCVE
jgi:hypothetical protein